MPWFDEKDWTPKDIPFTREPGPRFLALLDPNEHPAEWFDVLFDELLLEDIVMWTNLYAEQSIASMAEYLAKYKSSRVHAWRPTDVPELKNFFGLLFLTGLVWKPALEMYWSTEDCISTPYFSRTMPRNRFQIICRFLHFSDNREIIDPAKDPIYKIRPFLNTLLNRFREAYQPTENISIDEGMMLWRGRLSFRYGRHL